MSLSADVIGGLGGPPDPVFVTGGRYLRVSACVAHDCGDKGFFWIDSRAASGLGAHLAGDVLRLGSKDFVPARLPGPARQALLDWLSPRPRYHPPAGGPSFDCDKAATRIERAICSDPALAKSDLDLAELVHRIHQGSGTMGARRQLLALQRAWLEARDTGCRDAADLAGCLREQYRSQYDRLMNWVPAH